MMGARVCLARGDGGRARYAYYRDRVVRSFVVPSPSWSLLFTPQQRTSTPDTMTHVWPLPAAMALAPVIPLTATGIVRLVVVPSPSRPPLFSPQQRTSPAMIAHVWLLPGNDVARAHKDPQDPHNQRRAANLKWRPPICDRDDRPAFR